MMYQDRLALAVKVQGKVLREFKDTVMVPFGSEYSLLIKNLNSLRALVSIQIDGQDIADGEQFVVPANSSIDLERFLKAGNKNAGQRFKFIERTSRVEQHRGVGIEDGLIRIEFEFEREPLPIKTTQYWSSPGYSKDIWCADSSICKGAAGSAGDNPFFRSRGVSGAIGATSYSATSAQNCVSTNDAGITVGGSVSEQKFVEAAWFPTDGVKHVMVLKLVGEVGQQLVKKPITVKTKQKCETCGHLNKSSSKFCTECGTGLLVPS